MEQLWRRCVLPIVLFLGLAVVSLALYAAQPQVRAADAQLEPMGETIELPIVMYHHILREEERLNKYTIAPWEFRQDMQYLSDNGYTPITMSELLAWAQEGAPLPEKPAMITFDDGHESFHEYAYPILQEFGFKAVLSVVGTYVDEYSELNDHTITYSYCNWELLKEMQDSGLVEIQNHSYDMHGEEGRHGCAKLPTESEEEYREALWADIGLMQEKCFENLGSYPNTFTYPFGQISDEALPILKEMGFEAALTCEERFNHLTGAPEELYHLKRFNRAHNYSLEYLWDRARLEEEHED